jgi:hypothetical protein
VETVPDMAKRTASIEPAGRAEKATAARPKALDPGHMARQGTGAKCCHIVRPGMESTCHWKRASVELTCYCCKMVELMCHCT